MTKFSSLKTMFKNFLCSFRKNEADNSVTLRDTIEELIEESDEAHSPFERDERQLLGNVLNLRDLTAYNVMVPRADIIATSSIATAEEVVKLFIKKGVMRILVYQDNLDNVLGMLHVKDILAWVDSKKPWVVKNLMRKVLFISPTMLALDLLLKMRETGSKLAVVVDEYGGVDGLVTFSNLIEEIIGDIQDSHDQTSAVQIEIRGEGTIIADGRTTLEELEQLADVNLPLIEKEEGVETLGGLVVFLAGRVPVKGEVISNDSGIEFEILEADPRRVRRVCLRKSLGLKAENSPLAS